MIFWSIILIILGVTMFFKPDIIWMISESWKSDDASGPSYLFELSTKFGGIMFFIAGLAGIAAQILTNSQ